MAQSALTVTTPNPTPPTNFACTGATPPNVPNYTKNTMADPKNWSATNPKDFPPPYFDDGSAGAQITFAANTAALASGSGATAGGTDGTYPGTGTPPFGPGMVGAVPASTSVAHEGAGTETSFTQVYDGASGHPSGPTPPGGALVMVGCGPALTAGTMPTPNGSHASSLTPTNPATITTLAPQNSASGGGTLALTVTGTNFTKQSVVYVNGVAQVTVFVSSTSLTVAAAPKKATAGSIPVTVVTGGAVTTAATNWTFT